ncbi:MAG: hypothetical protein HUJ59_02865 [Bacilli bacterium]|nr:hypothetical protein [Bacilli bacterium]
MAFLNWMDELPKWAKILISLFAGWRAYEIVSAIVHKKDLVKPIVFAVLYFVIDWVDFFMIIFKNKHLVTVD